MPDRLNTSRLDGGLNITQPKTGYRFSIDALILAHHIRPPARARILDIGTGCGVIPLILARQYPEISLVGVEIQPELARIAESNVSLNNLSSRIQIIEKDIRTLRASEMEAFQIIACNPPHTPKAAGRMNPNKQSAVARHEIMMTITDLAEAANRLLTQKGHLMTIYPAKRSPEIISEMRRAGLEPKQLRTIHFKANSSARRVVIQAIKGGQPGLEIRPPLFIYAPDGSYTEEARIILHPKFNLGSPQLSAL